MKRLVLGLFLLVLSASSLYAATTTQLAVATVTVKSIFELTLDRTDIDFGSMRPGDVKYDIPPTGIKVTSRSNSGQKWSLKVSAATDFRDGDRVIENQNFYWYGWTEGAGKWYGTGEDKFATLPITVYESTDSEGINLPNGTNNFFKFKLALPQNQRAGQYATLVKFTLTE